ncbi:DUF3611 family protein [Myxosarcina sp. GI1]|uniref:DUF3611 family protein n=1 Tax=Myxosarcina sp. GI1 TaxID=1541065 RepID=UPI000562C3C4|nr:DUF3611 family protein [Myxosarcina sp. GI1]
MQDNLRSRTSVPSKQEFANRFRLLARISYWIHLFLGAVSGIILLLTIFSRSFSETNSAVIGLSLFFSLCSIVCVGFRVYWALRYSRLAKRLQNPNPSLHPKRQEIVRVLRIGLIVSLAGLLLAFLASEISTVATLAKAVAKPQSVAVYEREKVVRTLDLLLIFANVNILGAHFFGSVSSFVMFDWITKE